MKHQSPSSREKHRMATTANQSAKVVSFIFNSFRQVSIYICIMFGGSYIGL